MRTSLFPHIGTRLCLVVALCLCTLASLQADARAELDALGAKWKNNGDLLIVSVKIDDDDHFALFPQVDGLSGIDVSGSFSDAALAHLAGMQSLVWLEVKSTELTDDWGVGIEGKLPNLEHLRFAGSFSEDGSAYRFAKSFPKLKVLNLHHHTKTLGDSALAELAQVDTLEDLTMGGNGAATADGFKHVLAMKNLKRLNMNHCFGINSDEALANLAGHPTLEEINVSMIGDVGYQHLSTLPKLRSIHSSAPNCITYRGIAHLKKAPALQSLSIASPTLGDPAAFVLMDMQQLSSVKLYATRVSPDLQQQLIAALPQVSVEFGKHWARKYDTAALHKQNESRFRRHEGLKAALEAYVEERGVPGQDPDPLAGQRPPE